ncbi:ceramide synthase [Heterostelium album PN500]|uniref:Ceramide synthase n=1 Tax=Heterostelium pallidum (strain ATCC 26659 / Pp 5 / PN500) TaxID=670386 RepID=D3BG96_HETP5|nr:ceramide synthase [Heterostelium album PN500]EFA79496.1 ceramide synthase [Heterostelium album PN500]|eukprot:XP_020431617.1 ceramide synthase [Heterostelium album PN500]
MLMDILLPTLYFKGIVRDHHLSTYPSNPYPIAISYSIRKSFVPRFLENGWYSLYYITFFLFGSYVYSQESWSIFPTMNIWLGWPIQPFSTLFRTYYLLELSFYLHCTIALFFETRRKDFYQMLTHHIATFFLVGASYWYRYHRIGIAILWIHNVSDIFLYSAKALNYIQKETKDQALYILAEFLFVMFAVTFLIMRLMFLPGVLIRTTFEEEEENEKTPSHLQDDKSSTNNHHHRNSNNNNNKSPKSKQQTINKKNN